MMPSLRINPYFSISRPKISKPKSALTTRVILRMLCDYFEVSAAVIASKTRKREIVSIRHYYCYYAWIYTKSPLTSISSMIGNRDHSTVIHGRDNINDLILFDKKTKSEIERLDKLFETYEKIRPIN